MIKINNSKDPRMVLVHEQPGKGGLRFYRFKNPEEFPALRGLAAERAKRFAAMNLTEKELRALVKECKMKAGQQDLVTAFAIIHEIEFRLDFISEENSMLDLACLYYVLEDESPDTPSAEANTRKLAYMKNNPDARAFFLLAALQIINRYGNKSPEELLAYIEETAHLAERIKRFLPPQPTNNSATG